MVELPSHLYKFRGGWLQIIVLDPRLCISGGVFHYTRPLRDVRLFVLPSAGKSGRLGLLPRWCLNPLWLLAESQITVPPITLEEVAILFCSRFTDISTCCLVLRNVSDFRFYITSLLSLHCSQHHLLIHWILSSIKRNSNSSTSISHFARSCALVSFCFTTLDKKDD